MTRNNLIVLVIIIAIFGFSLWNIIPLLSSTDLVYQPTFSDNTTPAQAEAITGDTIAAIRERVSGLRDATVERYGEQGIIVKLPQASDETAAVNTIGSVAPFYLNSVDVHGERFGRKGLHLGLDLVGGVRLVYEAAVSDNGTEVTQAEMERALLTITKRIDKYGVAEPKIQLMSGNRIEVQLPGFTDIETAKQLVAQTGFLEFREVEMNGSAPVYLSDYLAQDELHYISANETGDRLFAAPVTSDTGESEWRTIAVLTTGSDGSLVFTDATGQPIDESSLSSFNGTSGGYEPPAWVPARGDDGTALTGSFLADASAGQDTSSIPTRYVVQISWNSQGAVIFDQIAARLYQRPQGSVQRDLGIVLDGTLLSAPQINLASYGGSGQIEGSFTPQQAQNLANLLKSGSLPIPLNPNPLFEQKVSATLGANFIHLSWQAGVIGIALVILFMIAYYGGIGFLASLALVFYAALVLAIFKLWPVTLSLAGLGGFIVSLGMAVDANVLIFERFKEELRKGRTMGAAVEEGFSRAWSAILDSNVTTIIACLILIWLASSVITSAQVQGFAVTLLIGVVMSMFSAIIVTRTLLRFFIHTKLGQSQRLFLMDWGKK
jgi:protein-export membrane protein SecD